LIPEYKFDDDTFEVTDEMKKDFDDVGYILVRYVWVFFILYFF